MNAHAVNELHARANLLAMPPRGRACKLSSINRRYPDLNLSLAPDGRFRFGRHPECEQSFPKDFRISGVHATLAVGAAPSGAVVEITDSSSNGTFVNGARLAKGARHALASGDELYLVIPSQDLLTGVGYIGSLTTNFVGYLFEYTDGLPGPPRAAAAAAAAVPAAPPEPGSPSAIGRDHAVRQTTDAPSWISRQPLELPGAACATVAEAPSAAPAAPPPRLTSFAMWWEHTFGEQVSRA